MKLKEAANLESTLEACGIIFFIYLFFYFFTTHAYTRAVLFHLESTLEVCGIIFFVFFYNLCLYTLGFVWPAGFSRVTPTQVNSAWPSLRG